MQDKKIRASRRGNQEGGEDEKVIVGCTYLRNYNSWTYGLREAGWHRA